MPDMTEAEYAAVEAALAGLTSAVRSLAARVNAATGQSRPQLAGHGRPCARSAA
jgi:hypothetical protein